MLRALPRLVLGLAALLAAIALLFWLSPATLERVYSFAHGDNLARPPVEIARGVYFIGASDVGAYLIETSDGLILIDAGYEDTTPLVLNNLSALGFAPSDVRIILNTHGHFDHAAGLAALKRATGARLYASAAEAALLRRGGAGDFYLRDFLRYPPVAVDAELADGAVVRLGETALTAHLTPGHTQGCTSWSFAVTLHDGREAQALLICSVSALRYDLVGADASYPGIAADYARSLDTLDALPCEMFLGAHGHWLDLEGKRVRVAAGERDAFYDPDGCRAFLASSRLDFEARLARQTQAAGGRAD